MTMISEE